jgi:hypothetical protein
MKRRKMGISKKFKSKYTLNMNFFKNWSSEMAYILGYIFADGSVRVRQGKSELSIKSKDNSILLKIKIAMESSNPIAERKNNNGILYQFLINRKEIVNDLIKYGVIPNKTFKMKFPCIPGKYLSHFIRGYFDGDGHVRILGNSLEIIFTSANEQFLLSVQEKILDSDIEARIYPKEEGSWFILSIINKDREKFFFMLYKDASIFLERKKKIFDEFFLNHNQLFIICVDCGLKIKKTGNNHIRCNDCKIKNHRKANRISYQKRKKR